MGHGDLLNQSQPETRAAHLGCEKGREELGRDFLRNPGTVVGDGQDGVFAGFDRSNHHSTGNGFRRCFDGVKKEILNGLPDEALRPPRLDTSCLLLRDGPLPRSHEA